MFIKTIIKIIILTAYLSIHTLYAKYITHDKIILKTNLHAITQSKIHENYKILKIITNQTEKPDRRSLNTKIINDLITLDESNIINTANFNIAQDLVTSVYLNLSEKYNISPSHFKKTIKEKYKIKENTLLTFIIGNFALKDLQKKISPQEINTSINDIKDFIKLSNYINQNKFLHEFKVVQISFINRNDKTLQKIKNILHILKKTNDIEIIKNQINLKNINIKAVDINLKNKHYLPIKEIIEHEKNKKIIGPLCIGRNIYIFKILEKTNNIENYKSYIKIAYKTLKYKKSKKPETFTLKTNICNIKKSLNKTEGFYWVHKNTINQSIYTSIQNLKTNNISKIIETHSGWYIVKILDKTLDQKSNIYTYIDNYIRLQKLKNISKSIMHRQFIKTDDIFYYN